MNQNRRFVMWIGLAVLLISLPATGGDPPPEDIHFEGTTGRALETPGVYPRIYSGRVEFPHSRHFSDLAMACDDCHHADSFDPGVGLESEVEITHCIDCHDAAGLVYGRRVDKLDDDELGVHRANVMHKLCVGCHEETAASNSTIDAPIACRGCHAQRQADYTLQG